MPAISRAKRLCGFAVATVIGSATLALPSASQAAMAVVDVKAITQMAKQLSTQASMLQTQLQQYQNMMTNSATFPNHYWGETMQSIAAVNNLLRQAQSLSYQSANIAAEIQSRYAGYGSYAGQTLTRQAMAAKYQQWSSETNSSVATTLQGLGLHSDQFADEDALMRQLESMGNSAQGRMQAAQVGNQLAAQAVRQTQKLRQLMMMQVQMQANHIAAQQDKANMQAAAGARAFAHTPQPTSSGRGFRYSRN